LWEYPFSTPLENPAIHVGDKTKKFNSSFH